MAFLTHRGRTLCYRLLGRTDQPLLILAHPLGMNQGVWDELIPALLSHYRLLSWDLPGHGSSAAWLAESDTISPEDLAQEALALAAVAGAETFHFIGTSIGGVVGQQLLAEHAGRLASAVLTNTGAVIGTAEAWSNRASDVMNLGLATMAENIVPRWFGPTACNQQPDLLSGWAVAMGRGDDRSYALLCQMLGQTDFRGKLGGHGVALTLVGGADDVATPPASLAELATECGADAAIILAQTGHVPSVECPARLADLLLGSPG